MAKSGTLQIKNLLKNFRREDEELCVLEGVNLDIAPGSFISLIGPSGCGKTTLLKLIVGLDYQYDGDIILDGKRITKPSLNRGIVFQDHRLLPWLTVEENIGFGLHGTKRSVRKKTVQEHIELVGLTGFEKSYPHQLSGGMAQRAAIARALANRPEVLLLDEPLGALDALTRMYMQQELEKIWQQEKITMIMVTHDIEEAIYLSDYIVVMSARPGKIKKIIPTPLARPRDRASADFIKIKTEVLEEFHLHAEHPFIYAI